MSNGVGSRSSAFDDNGCSLRDVQYDVGCGVKGGDRADARSGCKQDFYRFRYRGWNKSGSFDKEANTKSNERDSARIWDVVKMMTVIGHGSFYR